MARIQLSAVTKNYGAFEAVRGIDLDIQDQELMVFLGPSGCGKTTTMRMIAGLEDLSGGAIHIDGERIDDVDARDRDIAMVFQSYALYPNMTIYENIRFPLRMRGVPRAQHRARVLEAARRVELESFLHRKPAALSGGQRQRAALARAIVRQPRLFLMDEPLSNLDARLRMAMRVQLKHLQRELKITTIYVTHDQVEAMTLADRITIMNDGRIQQIGTPHEIYRDPANIFVAGFVGSPPMNLVAGRVDGGVFRAPGIAVPGMSVADGAAVTLGVRPEDARLAPLGSAHLQGILYGLEPMGDQTIAAVRTEGGMVDVKLDRDFTAPLDSPIAIGFDRTRLYLFDTDKGTRLREALPLAA